MNLDEDLGNELNEEQSLLVIRQMIEVSQQKLKNDGILFILWGWIAVINYFVLNYLVDIYTPTYHLMKVVHALRLILPLGGIAYTIYYMYQSRKKVKTFISISLRYVWIGLLACMVLINLIQFNVLHQIHFELQHPIFMAIIAFAIVITGGILRYNVIIYGGVFFGLLAYVASLYPIDKQLMIEALGWLVAFVIPGHVMYSQREK
ncbi:hypothetical protein [Carboxylicivirga linearis]|uniref:Uncharacterized protein n=1 Tax=Carboxylicivirga linearis TaxID=1628157 RepID=A0ABS5JQC8_9BACT|nr:hypothetical protein [Carboxylicivirga linearis]MBS2096676.1 hypothetical protein [Carboxylicivirga linearis]